MSPVQPDLEVSQPQEAGCRAEGGAGIRIAAARVVVQVSGHGKSLTDALPPALSSVAARDRGLLQELCYGTLRWYYQLCFVLGELLRKPLDAKEHEVRALLLLGLYQLLYMRVPAYAAVSTTVAAVRRIGKPWAVGLTNAVLRSFQRRREDILREVMQNACLGSAHPQWLLDWLETDWPERWPEVIEANNAHPPQSLRLNLRRVSRASYVRMLAAVGVEARAAPFVATGIVLESACDVERLPGFVDGMVSVQDSAAQLAAVLLDLRPNQRVLDACAAPGGKTCHILEAEPELAHVVALDRDAVRLGRIRENLQRLGLAVQLVEGDASDPQQWWDGKPYDRILLDAPCSATGVIRRHPDIKLLRKAADIARLAKRQQVMMAQLWPLLVPGGMLVYATCSVLKRENEFNVEHFLATHADARERPIAARWGHAGTCGRQILPGEAGMDGFFYACLVKAYNERA